MAVVLVVDDEWAIAEILAVALEDEGLEVMTACDGLHGLERMGRRRPDLVITDTQMPDMDGPSMVCSMAADPMLARVPVVAMSARSESDVGGGYPRYDAFVPKPFRIGEVVMLAVKLLGR